MKVFSPLFKGLKSHDLKLYQLKAAIYCISVVFIVIVETYYYYFRDISFNDLVPDFVIGLLIEITLIEIAFFGVQKIINLIKLEMAERQQLDEATRYRTEFSHMVTSISTKFINLSTEEIDSGITRALKEVGELAKVDRCHVFLIDVKNAKIENTHEWCAPGIDSHMEQWNKQPIMQFEWLMEKLNNFEEIHIPRITDLPSTAQLEQDTFTFLNIQSIVAVPIVYENNLMGYLGFDSVHKERIWPSEIITLLKIVGEIIANAIKRKEAEQKFEKFIEFAPIGIYYSDFTGTVNYVNIKITEMLGLTRNDLMGARIFDKEMIAKEQKFKALRLLGLSKRGIATGPDEFTLIRTDGSNLTVVVNTRVITFSGKRVILGMVSDITEQKQLEKHLRQAQKMEAITMVTGGIAHDFNNILGSIFGSIDMMLLKLEEDHPSRRYANIILDRSQKAADLVKQMLAYSRQQQLNLKVLNVNQILGGIANLLTGVLDEKIHFNTDLAPDLKNVKGDKTAIDQIVMNLCLNSTDAMSAGGTLTIVTRNVQFGEAEIFDRPEIKIGEYISIKVTDTGHGIPAEKMAKVFEPFFTTKEVGAGTGLGLSMVFGLVKQHNGYIYCTSEVNKHTTFEILLPAHESPAAIDQKEVQADDLYTGSGTILIVEDELDLIQILEEMLTTLGYEVICATDGASAMELFEQHQDSIDLIISDIIMPRMGGKELYRRVKAINPDTKFIFTTGYSKNYFNSQNKQISGTGILGKPFRLTEVAENIKMVLESN